MLRVCIPESWNEAPLKDAVKFRTDSLPENTSPSYQFRYVDIGSVEHGKGITKYQEMLFSESPSRARKRVRKGDTIVSTVRTYLKAIARVDDDENVIVSTGFFVLCPKAFQPRYLTYLMESDYVCDEINRLSWGVSYPAISESLMGSIHVPVPPFSEQECIAGLLDERCAAIDSTAAALEEQIDVLERYRASVIHEAVTKGLDPDAPMKPSGVEWMGSIPAAWHITKVKYLATGSEGIFSDGDWIESQDITESGIRYLTSGNVGAGYFKEQGSSYITYETFRRLNCTAVFPGDVLISRLNSPMGRACIVPDTESLYVVAVDDVLLRGDCFDSKYVIYAMNDSTYTEHLAAIARGSTMNRLSRSLLGDSYIWLPPIQEQEKISAYLDERCAPIDAVIGTKRKQLEALKKYRRSLIYEYVTGKRRVSEEV